MVAESIEFLKAHDRRVFFDAEHFFDGYRANPGFALSVLTAASEAGAERIVLCDTNGGTLPSETTAAIEKVRGAIGDTGIGVHYHDDVGTAVASSLAAVEAGVTQVQGASTATGSAPAMPTCRPSSPTSSSRWARR